MTARTWTSLSLLFVLLFTSQSWSLPFERPEPGFYRMQKFGELRCGYVDHPPYIYTDIISGEVKGPLADFAHNMVGFLKVNVRWVQEDSLGDVIHSLESHKYEVYCGFLPYGEELTEHVLLSQPSVDLPYYLYVRDNDDRFSDITSEFKFTDVSVLVQQGSLAHFIANTYLTDATLSVSKFETISDMVPAFLDSESDILLGDPAQIKDYMREHPDDIKVAVNKPLAVTPIVYAVSKKNKSLLSVLDAAVDGVHTTGKADSIFLDHDLDEDIAMRAQYKGSYTDGKDTSKLPPCAVSNETKRPIDQSVQQMIGQEGEGKSPPDACTAH